jgi:aprataxin and PNK-like factor
MTSIELIPLEGGDNVIIPSEKVTIGRGPFMQITDKRVSRNHATLEITKSGELLLIPIHANPCFYKVNDDEKEHETLPKDEKRILKDGNIIGLLPDKLFYKVIYKQQSKKDKKEGENGSEAEITENEDDDKPNGKSEDVEKKAENKSPSKKEDSEDKEDEEDVALPLEKDRKLPGWMKGAAKRVGPSPKKEESASPTRSVGAWLQTSPHTF